MSTKTGKWAEGVAADFLHNKGFSILAQNWKNRWCEIDIVAKNGKRIHFCEVKYRDTSGSGSATEYITRKKARQMVFAAASWVAEHSWEGDYQLDVIAIDGSESPKIQYIENAVGF